MTRLSQQTCIQTHDIERRNPYPLPCPENSDYRKFRATLSVFAKMVFMFREKKKFHLEKNFFKRINQKKKIIYENL